MPHAARHNGPSGVAALMDKLESVWMATEMLKVLHTHLRGYYRKAVNRFGHATPVHIHTMFASVDIKLKSI